jgi:DNA-binding response OmpR family regulator
MPGNQALILTSDYGLQKAIEALIRSANLDCEVLIAESIKHAKKTINEKEQGLVVLEQVPSKVDTQSLLALARMRGWKSLILVEGMREQTRMQVAGADVALVKGISAPELLETIIALLQKRID